jgi:hypothetical protein
MRRYRRWQARVRRGENPLGNGIWVVLLATPILTLLIASFVNGLVLTAFVCVFGALAVLAKIDWDRQQRKDGL